MSETEEQRRVRVEGAVHAIEGDGEILNDRYAFTEYLKARRDFLATHKDYQVHPQDFPSTERCARAVFKDKSEELSVQEVRRRELDLQIEPILPFKTKSNTQTLDDFASYPTTEWTKDWKPSIPQFYLDEDREDSAADHDSTNPAVPLVTDPATRCKNVPPPHILRQIIEDLGKPAHLRGPNPMIPAYRSEDGVASVSGRAISVPVKSPPQQQGKKRTASEREDDDEDDEPVIVPRPAATQQRRRVATKAPRKKPTPIPVESTDESEVEEVKRPAPKKLKLTVTKPATAPNIDEAIADGRRLPKSRAEAVRGAAIRKQKLLEARGGEADHPDLLPEFFEKQNFSQQEKAAVASGNDADWPLRCVCGAEDATRDWVACDTADCHVWQHVGCMGEGVPVEEKREEKDYFCHVCDPMGHRKVIQKMRKEHVL